MDLAKFESMDVVMLMSIINMKLRDDFGGQLDQFVAFYDISRDELEKKLAKGGFEYLPEVGQFR
ncbi:DUF4250 domain-containing protein [Vibrio ulleungensis]|uniref:DUF4250 domain-containing protein n=1 Tax=Vibrio ulleungensis TaxID=2807619 RepID=A0ABS2HH75_9VIBR|nr:DUF4250 domain-containing protein [Vibrio ulleungensis]MBM7036431.1 DUF4250 domain-containing protein [Vibrio ulleungensis]